MDVAAYYGPHALLAQEGLEQEGELPRWNPYQYAGTPFLGNAQGNYLYPPNGIFLAMAPGNAYELFVLLHLGLAAWGMYRLTRHFRLGRPACSIAGITYALSQTAVARIFAGHPTFLVPYALGPLLLLVLFRTLEKPSLRRVALLALAACAVLAGSHPQPLFHLALVAFGAAVWKIAARARRKEAWGRPTAAVLGGALLALMLAGAHLLPTLEVSSQATRGVTPPQYDEGIPSCEALIPQDLPSVLMPTFARASGMDRWVKGYIWHEKAFYVGVLPLLLAILALAFRGGGAVRFFAITGLAAAAAGMARLFPVHDLLGLLPVYGNFRVPARSIWIITMALSALAAFGWQAVTETRQRWNIILIAGALAASALILAGRYGTWREALLFAFGTGAAATLILLAPRARLAALGAATLVAADLFLFGAMHLKTVPPETLFPEPWYARHIGPERRDHRVLDLTGIDAEPMVHGFRLLRGCGYPIPRHLAIFYATAWENYGGPGEINSLYHGTALKDLSVFRALNVRWIVSRGPALHPSLKEVAREDGKILWEDPGARPAAFLDKGTGHAETSRGINRIDLTVRSEQPDTLIVSETWMPGWKAQLNEQPVPVVKAYGALLSVGIPAGNSRVTLTYDPPARARGWALSGAGLVILALMLAVTLRKPGAQQKRRP